MNEQRRSAGIKRYLTGVISAEVVLIVLSFVTAGFTLQKMAFPLAVWGTLALLYGLWQLAAPWLNGKEISAVDAMRGQSGANPLANYASMHEYKLTKLRQGRIDEERHTGSEAGSPDQAGSMLSVDADVSRGAVCVTIAALLVLGLSWTIGQILR